MVSKRFRATAHFPQVDGAILSESTEAATWPIALGRIARQLKKNPILKRRRITALSITLQMVGHGEVEQVAQDIEQSIEPVQTVNDNLQVPTTDEPPVSK